MQIKIVSVGDTETKGSGRKTYEMFPLTYIAGDGKVQVKKIMSFTNPDVFKVLSESKKGDTFDVKTEKNPEGYWEWTGIVTAVAEASSAAAVSEKTKWVPDSDKQRYIIRQNALTNAVNFVNQTVPSLTVEAVLDVAAKFESWVTRPLDNTESVDPQA